MKRLLTIILVAVVLAGCHTKAEEPCGDDCKNCKKKEAVDNKTGSKQLACKLTSPELRERKATVIASLKKQVLDKKELDNGYSYKFEGTDRVLDELASFIKSERQCCDFFSFNIAVNKEGFTWLEISGPDGVKEFIETEMQL